VGKKPIESLRATREKETEIWTEGGVPLLSVEIDYPLFQEPEGGRSAAVGRINRYYAQRNKQLIRLCKTKLLPRALAAYQSARAEGAAFSEIKAYSRSRVTFNERGLLSVCTDLSFSAFGKRDTRCGDVWNLQNGCPLTLSDFFPKHAAYKKLLKRRAEREIARLRERGLAVFHEGARRRIAKHFSPLRFYLTPEGPAIFYPAGSLAPRGEGVSVFVLNRDDGVVFPDVLSDRQ
jgi:hypothetical protein